MAATLPFWPTCPLTWTCNLSWHAIVLQSQLLMAKAMRKNGQKQKRNRFNAKSGGGRAGRFVVAVQPRASQGGLQLARSNGNGGRRKLSAVMVEKHALNAFVKLERSLPRPVAPYTDVRIIHNFTVTGQNAAQLYVFTPWMLRSTDSFPHVILPFVGYRATNLQLGAVPNGIEWLQSGGLRALCGEAGVELVPAAFTIRITSPTPLQTATGQWFVGRYPVTADPREYSTYSAIADGFQSYAYPRPLTSARLAMRAVQVSASPRNMNHMAEFLHTSAPASADEFVTQGTYPVTDPETPWGGMTPIVLYGMPGTSGTTLNVQVCIHLRARFGLANPAASTHYMHKAGTDAGWNDVVAEAAKLGHGVVDIVEGVAGEAENVAVGAGEAVFGVL